MAKNLMELLESKKDALDAVAPQYLTADRMIKLVGLCMSRQPELMTCTPVSVLISVMAAAQVGLEIGGPLAHAHLVAFNNRQAGKTECQLIIGFRGFNYLAVKNGNVKTIKANVVHEKDHFELDLAENYCSHRPVLTGDPGAILGVYTVAVLANGEKQVDYMRKEEVDEIRESSKLKNGVPWTKWYKEMMRKTSIKRACKHLPLADTTPQLATALAIDNRAESSSKMDMSDLIDFKEVASAVGIEEQPALKEPLRKSEVQQQSDEPTKINAKQAKLLGVMIGKSKMPHGEIKKVFSVENLADIPKERMQDVVGYIEAYDSNFTPPEEEPTDLWAAGVHNFKEQLGKDRFYQIIKGFKQNGKAIVHEDDIKGQALKDIVLQKLSMEIDKAAEKEEK